jgi:hypothetical protein
MNCYKTDSASIRVDHSNPNHHLYRNNGGYWWVYYQSYPTTSTAVRKRRSLGTTSLPKARRLRDQLFAKLLEEYVSAPAGGAR